MLLVLLRDDDLQPALLRQLTVAEAGHALAAVCRSARDAVRACKQWRPMWNSEHAVARVRALGAKQLAECPSRRGAGEPFHGTLASELESLARLLVDELLPAGVISLDFCLARARARHRRTLLGCHELRVQQPRAWVERLHEWALYDGSCFSDGLDDDPGRRAYRRSYPSAHVCDLLRDMHICRVCRFAAAAGGVPSRVLRDPLCWRVWSASTGEGLAYASAKDGATAAGAAPADSV